MGVGRDSQPGVVHKSSPPLTKTMVAIILESFAKERARNNKAPNGDRVYSASLQAFKMDLEKRQDDMERAKVTLVDLVNLFAEIVSKELVCSSLLFVVCLLFCFSNSTTTPSFLPFFISL